MTVGDDTRRMIKAGDLKAAMAEARRNKMIYLQEAALRKVVDGETTIEEVVRVMAPAARKAKPQPEVDPATAT
jgi:type II secretory ATPase GspE/PulE/Tfp pilus assembly ATPase PilB-like protein